MCPIALSVNTIGQSKNKLKNIFKIFDNYLAEKTENKISLKLILLFIPAAYVTNLFHEFGHWITGEILGNDMTYSLNYVWPKNGHYVDASNDLYVSIGGPAFTILLSVIFLLVIEKYKNIYAYPFVFFPMFSRFFSILLGGFSKQDESRISVILENGAYTVAIIVLMILLLLMLRGSFKLKIGLKNIGYFLAISTLCQLLVIGTYKMIP